MFTEETLKAYMTVGAGGVAFLTIIWQIVFNTKKLYPLMTNMNKALDNNTKAMESVVAMEANLREIKTSMDRHEIKTDINHDVAVRMEQSLKSLHKRLDDREIAKLKSVKKKLY